MPLFNPDVPDIPDLVTYQTEAEFDAATDGYAVLKVNSETDWPTIWQFPFFKGSGSYVGQVVSLANSGGTEIRISQVVTSDRGDVWNRYRYYYPAFDSYDPFSDWEKVPVLRDPTGIVSANPSVPTWDGNWGPYTEIVSDPADVGANGSIARRKSSGRVAVGTPTDDDDATTKAYVDASAEILIFNTEAEMDGAAGLAVGRGQANVTNSTDWPTLWALVGGFPTTVMVETALGNGYSPSLTQRINTWRYVWTRTNGYANPNDWANWYQSPVANDPYSPNTYLIYNSSYQLQWADIVALYINGESNFESYLQSGKSGIGLVTINDLGTYTGLSEFDGWAVYQTPWETQQGYATDYSTYGSRAEIRFVDSTWAKRVIYRNAPGGTWGAWAVEA